jgi:hypothetical protein
VQNAVIAARASGVAVRVLLSDPAKNSQNTATQTLLTGKGIPTKSLYANYLKSTASRSARKTWSMPRST